VPRILYPVYTWVHKVLGNIVSRTFSMSKNMPLKIEPTRKPKAVSCRQHCKLLVSTKMSLFMQKRLSALREFWYQLKDYVSVYKIYYCLWSSSSILFVHHLTIRGKMPRNFTHECTYFLYYLH
jgi:hypothetical protein